MKSTLSLILGLLLLSGVASATTATKLAEPGLSCKYLDIIEQGFLNNHISYRERDNALEKRVIEQYIKRLDPTKMYLLQADVDQITKAMSGAFNKVKNKDCKFSEEVQTIYANRLKERAEYAKSLLGKNYKFDKTVEIMFDPDKRTWAKNITDSNEFLKKYVHFQISNYLATDIKLDEAKQNVIKNYDRTIKKLQERRADDLYADYLDAFARSLDPHSSFFSRDILEDFEINMSLSLEGIGATLSSQDGFTVVEQLVPGGGAARCNCIEPQDKIVAVAQGETGKMENVIEMDLRDVVRKIRGEKGTKVRLMLLRKKGDSRERLTVTLERDKIKLEDDAAQLSYIERNEGGNKKKIAILNLPSFYADSKRGGRSSAADVKKLIAEAVQQKADGMILDLSNNGGGSLDDSVKIAGLFFQTGNVVKQSSREAGRGEMALKDIDPTVDWAGPLVVLTSRVSASASEIVSGTLQDYKRAVVVGSDHTFGKGSVQSVIPMPQNLGALKVTVGMFFTAGGKSTQHRGVNSDVILPSPFATDEIGEKSLDYSLPPKEIASFTSPEALPKTGPGQWMPIKPDWIKTLRERSETRVSQNTDFKKIVDELKKSKENGRLIKLADVMKESEDKEKKKNGKRNQSKEEKSKEYLKRADIQEAANVLADLILLEDGKPLALVETTPVKK